MDAYIDKPWGYERLWACTDSYAGKILYIRGGEMLSLQYHERKAESILVLLGTLELTIGDKTHLVLRGEAYDIPPKTVHRMRGVTNCEVVEVSTPELGDVVRLDDIYGRQTENENSVGKW